MNDKEMRELCVKYPHLFRWIGLYPEGLGAYLQYNENNENAVKLNINSPKWVEILRSRDAPELWYIVPNDKIVYYGENGKYPRARQGYSVKISGNAGFYEVITAEEGMARCDC